MIFLPTLTELKGIVIPGRATLESLEAEGNYDYKSDRAKMYLTSEYFHFTVRGPRRLYLAEFSKTVSTYDIEIAAHRMDYEMALVEDLASVGAHPIHRNLQRCCNIYAFGSSIEIETSIYIPDLTTLHGRRSLGLCDYHSGWHCDHCRFLFVDLNE